MGQSEALRNRDDEALDAFRKAAHNALTMGFDPELLIEEIVLIWQREFDPGEDE
jgi:hypothetical protein